MGDVPRVFQTVLLFGYAYADWSTRSLKPRTQAALHIALLAASLALLPIIPDVHWKPGADEATGPALSILALLGATIGLQYFLLSTTSPLVQAWFWRRFHHAVPYRLFALSNFASLLALLAYPVADRAGFHARAAVGLVVGRVRRVCGAVRGDGDCDGPALERGGRRMSLRRRPPRQTRRRRPSDSARCGSRWRR